MESKKEEKAIRSSLKPVDPGVIIKTLASTLIHIAHLPARNIKKIDKVYLTPLSILLTGIMISGSIIFSFQSTFKIPSANRTQAQSQPAKSTISQGTTTAASAKDVEPLKASDHVRGDRNARILLIEYSDLECPFCKKFHPTAQQAIDEYQGKVAWVYRHFPLDAIHTKAGNEAEAVECANELGGNDGFWKLVDKIYEVTPSNNGLNLDDLPKLAAEVGLDQNKFNTCLDSGKYKNHVQEDYQSGVKAGVTGTPGNILLDTQTKKTRVIKGAASFDVVKKEIDSLLNGS